MGKLRTVSDTELLRIHAQTHQRFVEVTKNIDPYAYVDDREGGSHMHRTVRDEERTSEGGGHSHLFILDDGSYVYTEDDGFHMHDLEDAAGNETAKDGKHKHKLYVDGREFETSDRDSEHDHELGRMSTLWDGLHTHTISIDGKTYTSETPGSVWDKMGRPSQSKNSRVRKSASGLDIETEDPYEVQKNHRDVVVEMARRGMDHDTPLRAPEPEGDDGEVGEDEELTTLYVEFSKKDNDERIVTGVVLEPEEVDAQGDIYDEDVVKSAQQAFTAGINQSTTLGYMHTDFSKRFELVESYIAPSALTINKRKVKKGSWIMSVKVIDDDVWNEVKDGKINGFSIQGLAKVVRLGKDTKSSSNASTKKRKTETNTKKADAATNDLPDAAFAIVLPGGKKDSGGKTTPRGLRKLPHHSGSVKNPNENSSVDLARLRNALARVNQIDATPAQIARARRHLERHARELLPNSAAAQEEES